jgi:hypothetical protein
VTAVPVGDVCGSVAWSRMTSTFPEIAPALTVLTPTVMGGAVADVGKIRIVQLRGRVAGGQPGECPGGRDIARDGADLAVEIALVLVAGAGVEDDEVGLVGGADMRVRQLRHRHARFGEGTVVPEGQDGAAIAVGIGGHADVVDVAVDAEYGVRQHVAGRVLQVHGERRERVGDADEVHPRA